MSKIKLLEIDPWLSPFATHIESRVQKFRQKLDDIEEFSGTLKDFASGHLFFGLHRNQKGWIFREWAPNAIHIYLIGDFSDWKALPEYKLLRKENGIWEIQLPENLLTHGDLYKLLVQWEDGEGERIPAYANRVIQDEETKLFSAQVWELKERFNWTDEDFESDPSEPLIYEAHVGMSSPEEKVASYSEFTKNVLPRIKELGYNTIQLMAIQEHPYYGSFGYHVANFFAASSRFGTPEDLKELVNTAHNMGINVIMDLVHSHAVKNELEGLSRFDGTTHQYFHEGPRGDHPAWDSKCFNYGKDEVMHFLLSNCRYWIEEYHFDGFRFDGVTSMLYYNHGLEVNFTSYSDYFKGEEDIDAMTYLTLANKLIHDIKPNAICVAEEMSGYPGLAGKIEDGGIGFDFRLSMGIPDFWIKIIKEKKDEEWNVAQIYHELSQHRPEEKTVSYVESHDQALVGDKTIFFRLVDKEIYYSMSKNTDSLIIDRGIALHKMIRLVTLGTATGGYLTFMGNEFGHPEWIDFPREGNNWSFKYARRQWNLADDKLLKFHYLKDFDKEMINLFAQNHLLPVNPFRLHANEQDQVLAFNKNNYIFIFNFNPNISFEGYGIPVPKGKYKVVLDTDDDKFGGFQRIDTSYIYYSEQIPMSENHQIKLYLPARTAIVLEKQKIKRVR
ncbi:MAG: 1,4-alpha-glucan-branching enzyme [Chlorobi bacterium]|nr:1,4-alpha-glucan-branching enzyme [Chlorobiota bacterium]